MSTMSLTTPVPAHLVEHGDAAGVGDHAVGHLGQPEARALGRDADVAQQRPLERAAHHPALARDDHRRVEVPELLDAAVAAAHQLVVRQLDLHGADRADVAARRERLALAPPDDRPDVGLRPRARRGSSKSCASMSSSNALCLSGLSLVIVAIAPSISSRTRCGMARVYGRPLSARRGQWCGRGSAPGARARRRRDLRAPGSGSPTRSRRSCSVCRRCARRPLWC